MKTIVGLYDDIADAQSAVEELVEAGFARNDISLVAADRDNRLAAEFDLDNDSDQAAQGAAAGAVAGTAIGGVAGLLVGLGALAIPGVGPIVAAGPILAALTGAGIGAAAGGLIGALVGWGIPEEEAEYYAEGVRRGGTLVAVKALDTQTNEAMEILGDHDPVDIAERSAYWRASGWTGFDEGADPYTDDDDGADRLRRNTYDYEDYDSFAPAFRSHYQMAYGTTGYPYTYYEPGYRYGYLLATDDRYVDHSDWNSLQATARRDWEVNPAYKDSAWDDFKDSVQYAWEEVKDAFDFDDDDDFDDDEIRTTNKWERR